MSTIWNVLPWYGWLSAGWFLVVIAGIAYAVRTSIPDPWEDGLEPESNLTPDRDCPERKAADCREGRTHGQSRTLLPARRGDL